MATKYERLKHEHAAWLRMLHHFQYENNQMKNCISEKLQNDINKDALNKLEHYQTDFLHIDTVILLLLRDIANLKETIRNRKDEEDEKTCPIKNQNRLRKEMQKIEKEFYLLKFDFYKHLSEV
jgi:hypothetical protein